MALLKVNKEKKEKLAHILAGLIILVHAYEKYDLQESSYVFFFVAGIGFLSVALLHHRLAKHFQYVDGVFFVIEAVIYAVIAADYFHQGKRGLPWCYVFCTVAYIIVAFVKRKKGKARHANADENRNRHDEVS
ncbi:MAG: hypothetical protein ABI863_16745 [Ginsengibacter sp.]